MKKKKTEIQIQIMGRFVITVNGEAHDELITVSPKGLSLLELLILEGGNPVSSEILKRELWHQEITAADPEEAEILKHRAKLRLKTLVCRTRDYLNHLSPGLEACIVSGRGAYAWQGLTNVSVDVEEMKSLCAFVTKAPSFGVEQWNLAEKLIALYGTGLSLTGDWQSGPQQSFLLHEAYLKAIFRYLESLEKNEEYFQLYTVCREELKRDPENSDLLRMQKAARAELKERQIPIPDEADRTVVSIPPKAKERESIPQETAAALLALPIVEKVTAKRVVFTQEFKDFFAGEYENGENAWDILRKKGADPELIGIDRINGLCSYARKRIRQKQIPHGQTHRIPDGKDSLRMSRRIFELENQVAFLNRKIRAMENK